MATPEEVLAFWFEEPTQAEADLWRKIKRWFRGGAELDQAIRDRFGADVELALEGKLDGWAETPGGMSALVLLLDQFTRSIYRDSPRAFAGDARAQILAQHAFHMGLA